MIVQWRQAQQSDIDAIFNVQCIAHALHPESREVLSERLALSPEGCLVLDHEGTVAGYVLSHPWIGRSPPPLDVLLGALPSDANVWYLHDLALLPVARGAGAARSATTLLAAVAACAGFERMALVSVNGSKAFWERQDFSAVTDKVLVQKLETYGEDALYMERVLRF